jgi:hypothetical protein
MSDKNENEFIRRIPSLSLALLASLATFALSSQGLADALAEEAQLRGRPILTQSGQLFVIQLSPKDRSLSVKAVGNEVASLDPSRIKIFGRVYPKGRTSRDLKVAWINGRYQIFDPESLASPVEIEVTDKQNEKSETFQFNGPRLSIPAK